MLVTTIVLIAESNCSVNDLLSVKKEIAQGSAESLVPIIYSELKALPQTVETILMSIRNAVRAFDIVSKKLIDRYESYECLGDLVRFIDGCKFYCTGNLAWRYKSSLQKGNSATLT